MKCCAALCCSQGATFEILKVKLDLFLELIGANDLANRLHVTLQSQFLQLGYKRFDRGI